MVWNKSKLFEMYSHVYVVVESAGGGHSSIIKSAYLNEGQGAFSLWKLSFLSFLNISNII